MRWFALGCAVLSSAACAGRPEPRGDGPPSMPSVVASGEALLFVSFDADRDYRTSQAEFDAGARAEWDRQGGAPLTPIAFQQWSQNALGDPDFGPYRLQFDANVDGEITQTEFAALLQARFGELDANDDGFVARAELVRRLPQPQMMQRRPMRGPPPGGMRPPGG